MRETADDRLADLLVRRVREQRRRRDWGHEESAASPPRATGDGASGGTEQDPRRA
ncbi:hypothetical protein [Microbispora sp. KK1-11]|uniref:hypothetical protein n=1 Tax=Microbispora sp. KK1-11 TaxID=2053005 RepID=UPI00163CDD39|nr:hypothetical protein [Microbispora sp. KK1-11]